MNLEKRADIIEKQEKRLKEKCFLDEANSKKYYNLRKIKEGTILEKVYYSGRHLLQLVTSSYYRKSGDESDL